MAYRATWCTWLSYSQVSRLVESWTSATLGRDGMRPFLEDMLRHLTASAGYSHGCRQSSSWLPGLGRVPRGTSTPAGYARLQLAEAVLDVLQVPYRILDSHPFGSVPHECYALKPPLR